MINKIKLILIIFIFKFIILATLPITGDEAYFVKWADHLSDGYYDHPPMVGWLIYFMNFISDSFIFYRIFAFISTLVVAYVIYKILELYKIDKIKSQFIALIFLVSPIDILMTLFTNDTALVLFGAMGTLFLLYSFEYTKHYIRYSILAGIFLGFSFLSKYFAGFLLVSLLLFALFVYGKKVIKNILIVTLVVSVFIAQNLYFNYNSCWNNIMFNFFARTASDSFHISYLEVYFSFIIYLISPWGLYFIIKDRRYKIDQKLVKLIWFVLILALAIFFKVSLTHRVGLHWFLLFIPFGFLLFAYLTQEHLDKLFRYNFIWSLVHIVLMLTIIFIPKSYFSNNKQYSNIILFTQTPKICKALDQYDPKKLFATGYTPAAVLSYHCKKDIKMLFNNSKFGRLDDKLLDVRTLKDQDLVLFRTKKISQTSDIAKVCQELDTQILEIDDAKFYISRCKKFDYKKYKQYYLDVQKKKFYNIPKWLPVGKCYFFNRYYQ